MLKSTSIDFHRDHKNLNLLQMSGLDCKGCIIPKHHQVRGGNIRVAATCYGATEFLSIASEC